MDNFFTQRVVGAWNSLPLEVVEADTVVTFKGHLDKYMNRMGYRNHRNHTVQKEAIRPIESAPTTIPPRPYPRNPTYPSDLCMLRDNLAWPIHLTQDPGGVKQQC